MPTLSVFELRNYTTTPGQRDVLIELFEREFIESQEAVGAYVLGTFRNLDDPDRFVWIRGFTDMSTRAEALDAFYTGALWQARRNEANATIADSDNALLLRSVSGNLGHDPAGRPAAGSQAPHSLVVITTYFLPPNAELEVAAFFSNAVAPLLIDAGGAPLASFASEHASNSYPRLPIREGENVFVSVARFASPGAHDAHLEALENSPRWQALQQEFRHRTIAPPLVLRLRPTARSLLR